MTESFGVGAVCHRVFSRQSQPATALIVQHIQQKPTETRVHAPLGLVEGVAAVLLCMGKGRSWPIPMQLASGMGAVGRCALGCFSGEPSSRDVFYA